jgi:hypothetical protein
MQQCLISFHATSFIRGCLNVYEFAYDSEYDFVHDLHSNQLGIKFFIWHPLQWSLSKKINFLLVSQLWHHKLYMSGNTVHICRVRNNSRYPCTHRSKGRWQHGSVRGRQKRRKENQDENNLKKKIRRHWNIIRAVKFWMKVYVYYRVTVKSCIHLFCLYLLCLKSAQNKYYCQI